MNNLLKKQKNVSISVIRALNRINGYIEKEAVPSKISGKITKICSFKS
tara:strand:- start:434 stop:577 length:144 start_codon:yes stop_codon:yes gene_type:complete